ncbi:Protein of unknown function [Anaerobranca californiensis DSM 14826]|uniref:DUF3798 domain-containing protein n=1 Tax=Anaerobranca californiensis DSM 14826 TaxID=1120989 RepID=A0A1M6QWE4_9FIRM|nr:DUF3798 domain-containing protein [Anaerobranca californiensis]SHK24443.1 Protein of unknown function [Anaerobranca californiensis DSM 14826]
MRKIFFSLLIGLLIFTLLGCGGKNEVKEDKFRIGIVTGTVSQGEEEFVAAQDMVKKYGEDVIKHVTYPDNFTKEQETTIANIVNLAADPLVKVIVIVQGVPGTAAAIEQVRETRDDVFFIVGVPHEDPAMIAKYADIVLETDNLFRGVSIMEQAKAMGAEKFIHYSFPRHMSYELLASRRDKLRETAEKLGIEFIEVDAPDPLGDAGIPGTQQFILEDVSRQVEVHGPNTAFFGTNCAMQEPLIREVLKNKAIYAEQCCPSPYHAYPGALGVSIPSDKTGDLEYLFEQIKIKVAEAGNTGRMATWKAPANMAMIWAATEYGVALAKGEVQGVNYDVLQKKFNEAVGGEVQLELLKGTENFYLFVVDSIVF